MALFKGERRGPDLAGKVVLVTGGGGALGSTAAARMASLGARIAIADLDDAAAERVAAELIASGSAAAPFIVDVLDDSSIDKLIERVLARFGTIDILVSAAGVEVNADFRTVTVEELDLQLGLHLRSPMVLVSKILPTFLANDSGHVVIVSSMSGKVPLPAKAPYAAAKAGAIAFSHSLRRELADTGVRVSVITPGLVSGAGQAHRAISGTSVKVPRTMRMVTRDDVADGIIGALGTGNAEIAVTATSPALLSGLQAATPGLVDRILKITGMGDFLRNVAREHGRA
ncbi:hypothetical protein BOO86_08965 [Mycobacterium sp. CBMA 234]|uniref:SDR family NAD(P)-dependent oxidoreductase n=1 Tax=Mycolicibacterium sp. CBMA 234 TaxID=1918495 RepID=UPI0013915E1D|nr:SDR family NAD(P)-dependent oxidoreductase [Mycolicibacterium sp. CBMA 234]MUL64590.1 hypothetical protein [Mycolicibacterium sp. CBMA 234]